MRRGLSYSERRRPSIWALLGWLVLVGFGVAMIWFGLLQPYLASRQEEGPEATQPSEGAEAGTPAPVLYPTFTPVVSPIQEPAAPAPTIAPVQPTSPLTEPTAPPPSPTPTEEAARARAVVDEGGVNFRSGPGTNYELYELIPAGTEVDVIGQYPDWWKIRYNGQEGWVFGGLVTPYDTEDVPQAEAPPSPVPPPATEAPPAPEPTEAPSSSGPSAVTEIRGIVADKFEVEGAPGPYAVGQDIWFHMWITNKTGAPVEYQYLGVQVEENGEVQKSWIFSEFAPNKQFHHRDHLYDQISSPGTYHLWLVVMFRDGNGFRLAGPVEVIVQ